MNELNATKISCPYCGESIEVLIDGSESQQNYVEDCQVCCRPIEFSVQVELNGDFHVVAAHEND
jgi:hypothetical protein